MPDSYSCYKCEADVLPDMSACPSCDAPQNKEAYRAFQAERRVEQMGQRWRTAIITVGVLMFGLGGGLGFWLGGSGGATSQAQAAADASASATQGQDRQMNREQINDAFKQYINANLHLNIVDWRQEPQQGLVLEMAPPNQTDDPVVWEQMTAEEKRKVIGYLGIVYTSLLQAEDSSFNLAQQGHPAIVLQYEGIDRQLAVRDREGQRRVFRSPFQQQPQ